VMGVLVGAVFTSPPLLERLASGLESTPAGVQAMLEQDPDRMVPMFVLALLPAGLVGLIFIAILSALMSSLDSAINSLSAVTMQDLYRVYVRPRASDRHYLIASKILTLFWGAFCVLAALAFARAGQATRQTTIVLINAIGSLLYGPILAAFLLGMVTRTIRSFEVKAGVVVGIAVNVVLWQLSSLSWLWWNLTGFAATVAAAGFLSLFWMPEDVRLLQSRLVQSGAEMRAGWRPSDSTVVAYFFLIIMISYLIQTMA